MEYSVGEVFEGKVTGITKFGAFVAFGEGKSGLVHISEIANAFVREVSEHLTMGQQVKVKIISIDDAGRINLSIKKAMDPPAREAAPAPVSASAAPRPVTPADSFEDKLKLFMQDSNSKMSDLKHQADRKGGSRRPRQRG